MNVTDTTFFITQAPNLPTCPFWWENEKNLSPVQRNLPAVVLDVFFS